MKRIEILLAGLLTVSGANAYAGVGVSVSIGEPGFYGQIDIGDTYPAPRVVNSSPMVIQAQPAYANVAPIYLYVPPGQIKHWSRSCSKYNACGRPVYFVNDSWYNNTYAPRYREYHAHGDDGKRYSRGDYGDKGHGDDRGRGDDRNQGGNRDQGHGNDHGHDR
jgi:hypothetical protein